MGYFLDILACEGSHSMVISHLHNYIHEMKKNQYMGKALFHSGVIKLLPLLIEPVLKSIEKLDYTNPYISQSLENIPDLVYSVLE